MPNAFIKQKEGLKEKESNNLDLFKSNAPKPKQERLLLGGKMVNIGFIPIEKITSKQGLKTKGGQTK